MGNTPANPLRTVKTEEKVTKPGPIRAVDWWMWAHVMGEDKPRKFRFKSAADASLTIQQTLDDILTQFQLPPLVNTMKFYCLKENNGYYYTPRLNGKKRLSDYHILPGPFTCLFLCIDSPVT